MIDKDRTKKMFGHTYDSLSHKSKKRIALICDYCGNEYDTIKKNRENSRKVIEKDCCNKCKFKKREEISLHKYGVKNSAQRPEVRAILSEKTTFGTEEFEEKKRKTMIERYGVEQPMHSNDIKDKYKKTVREKYGVDNVSQNPEVRKKIEETNFQKFGNKHYVLSQDCINKRNEALGGKNAFQLDEVKNKSRKTMLSKYGYEYATQSEEIKQKIRDTNIEKYGVDNVLKLQSIKDKISNTCQEIYGVKNPAKSNDIQKKMKNTRIKNGTQKTFRGKTNEEWSILLSKPYSTFNKHVRDYGFEEAIKIEKRENGLEAFFKSWLVSEGIDYKSDKYIDGRRYDFLIDDVVIELDGLYWHSEINLEKNYHKKKREHYIERGYKPLFFREHEIRDKFDIVTSIVKNALNKSTKIFARKCKIKEVSKKEAKIFLRDNHLMGMGRGDSFGLYYNGVLISLLCMCRIKGENYDISRFCHKRGVSVTGGFSKLLKYFENNRLPLSVRTFIDLRYGSGEYLPKFGFEEESCNLSFKWTDGIYVANRMVYPGSSGYSHGMCKIWDCGQRKYMKYYK